MPALVRRLEDDPAVFLGVSSISIRVPGVSIFRLNRLLRNEYPRFLDVGDCGDRNMLLMLPRGDPTRGSISSITSFSGTRTVKPCGPLELRTEFLGDCDVRGVWNSAGRVCASISAEKRTVRGLGSNGVVETSVVSSTADEGRGRDADLRGPTVFEFAEEDGITAVFNDNELAAAFWAVVVVAGIIVFIGSDVGRGSGRISSSSVCMDLRRLMPPPGSTGGFWSTISRQPKAIEKVSAYQCH